MTDVTIIGSGPNGMTAAVICARAGLSVRVIEAQPTPGGGARTLPDPEFPGVTHDICSAVHPLALASPFFAEFDLRARGVELAVPPIRCSTPPPPSATAIWTAPATSWMTGRPGGTCSRRWPSTSTAC